MYKCTSLGVGVLVSVMLIGGVGRSGTIVATVSHALLNYCCVLHGIQGGRVCV